MAEDETPPVDPEESAPDAAPEPDDEPDEVEQDSADAVSAPVVEDSNPGSLTIVRREEFNLHDHRNDEGRLEMPKAKRAGKTVRMDELSKLWLQGEDFPAPGEVIIDVSRNGGQDHQRFSTWTSDGSFDITLPGIVGPGSWSVHAESLITQVGEGREDHRPLIKVGETHHFEVTA